MKIAVIGCAHGMLDSIYESVALYEAQHACTVDMVICCGDFQAIRNLSDMKTCSIPDKYKRMTSFHQYYSGAKRAPVLTLFVGGNHESAAHMEELRYGGWVAPNMYFLGYEGVVRFAGLRIGGISGIYKSFDSNLGHFERPPFNEKTKRSMYHTRVQSAMKLLQLLRPSVRRAEQQQEKLAGTSTTGAAADTGHRAAPDIDIFVSHDWPLHITRYGNSAQLFRKKPFFAKEQETLGSPLNEVLLQALQPSHWFSAHLHCKFSAVVPHPSTGRVTRFLALDKILPRRRFMQVIEMPFATDDRVLRFDTQWLAVTRASFAKMSRRRGGGRWGSGSGGSAGISVADVDSWLAEGELSAASAWVVQQLRDVHGADPVVGLAIPTLFAATVPCHGTPEAATIVDVFPPNPQKKFFLDLLGLEERALDERDSPYSHGDGGGGGGRRQQQIHSMSHTVVGDGDGIDAIGKIIDSTLNMDGSEELNTTAGGGTGGPGTGANSIDVTYKRKQRAGAGGLLPLPPTHLVSTTTTTTTAAVVAPDDIDLDDVDDVVVAAPSGAGILVQHVALPPAGGEAAEAAAPNEEIDLDDV